MLFLTSHVYATCDIVNGKQTCFGMEPILISIHSDKSHYENSDKPVITITGVPNKLEYLEIHNQSGNVVFSQSIELPPTGVVNYILDISSYKLGVYSAIASTSTSNVTAHFMIGLPSGPPIALNVVKNTYTPGDSITILGAEGPDRIIQLSLVDPNGNVVKSVQTNSDNTGQFSSNDLKIPTNAISGIWQINATHGISYSSMEIKVNSSSTIASTMNSPLKQFKSGIKSHDVKCILGFELILKTENNSPACVELETAQKFVDRGWAKMIISNVLNSGTIVTIPVNSSISTSGLTFSPSTVQVVIGVNSTVEWINMDSVMNDITSDSRSFETSLIPHGHAWEHIFDKIGTYQYHSAIHPWLKGTVIVVENNASSQQISNSDQQAKLLSENDCGQFYTVPENHTSLNTVPFLLIKTNSTACARLTFTIISNYNDCNGPNCQHVLDVEPTGLIGNLHYEKHGDSFSITPGKDYTNSFKIVTIPSTIDLANYPVGTNYTVTYIIRPLSNATGFYDQSIPRLACERYPLAVGYTADQVNASDFSYIDPLNPPCVSGAYVLTKVEISGMDYKEVILQLEGLEQ